MTFSSPPHPAGPGSGAVQLLCPLPAPGGGLGRWASPGLAPGVWEEAEGCRVLGPFPSLEARVLHRDLSHVAVWPPVTVLSWAPGCTSASQGSFALCFPV